MLILFAGRFNKRHAKLLSLLQSQFTIIVLFAYGHETQSTLSRICLWNISFSELSLAGPRTILVECGIRSTYNFIGVIFQILLSIRVRRRSIR